MGSLAQSKHNLRKHFRHERRALSADLRYQKQQQIVEMLIKLMSAHPGIWGVYASQEYELCLDGLLAQNPKSLQFAFPKVNGVDMQFHLVPSLSKLSEGAFGIREPSIDCQLVVPDHIVVPGVAFDRWGSRVGSGKGFYDRYLKDFKGLKVGVCFLAQVSDFDIPVEPFDVRMDQVITEDGMLTIRT